MKFSNPGIKFKKIESLVLPDEIRDELINLSADMIPFLIPYRNSSKFFKYNEKIPLVANGEYYDQDHYSANFEDETINNGSIAPLFGMSLMHIEGIDDSETGRIAFRNTARFFDKWTVKEQYENTKVLNFVKTAVPMTNVIGIRFHKIQKGSFAQYHTDNWPNYPQFGINTDENANSELWDVHGYTQITFMFSLNDSKCGKVVVFDEGDQGFVLSEEEMGKSAFTFDDRLVHGVPFMSEDTFVLRITGKLNEQPNA